MSINAYYEDELSYLRDLGGAFATANPRLANFLGREASDPDVERLLEGFAFLTARLRQRLDNELPELSHSLIRLVWPHYLRPIPSLTMLRFDVLPGGPSTPVRVPAGMRVRSRAVDGVSCSFATCNDLTVMPFNVGDVEFESRPTSARLVFRLRVAGKANLTALSGGKLKLFFNTERELHVGRTLLLWFSRHVRQIECTAEGGSKVSLGQTAVKAAGFTDEEAVLPWPINTFSGFRLLQEYLTYPTKFLFIDISGLEALAADDGRSVLIAAEFDRPFPSQFRLSEGQIRLNCVPAINIFTHDADPIRVERAKTEYRVLPLGGGATNIYSIEEVVGYQQGRSGRRIYEPFESFRYDPGDDSSEQRYFRERLRPSITDRRADTYLSFVERGIELASADPEVISVKLKCTNGVLAERLGVGSIDQPGAELPAGLSVSNITSVSPEIPAPIGSNLLWRLISNLARNYGSFANVGALRSAIATYDFQAIRDAQARRRLVLLLESLERFEVDTRDTVIRGIPARLRHMTLAINENKLGGEAELFLFGSVMDAFFANYVAVNSLHQFAAEGIDSKVLFKWPSRFGSGRVN